MAVPGSSTPWPPHTAQQKEGRASSGAFGTSRFGCSPALPEARGGCGRWQQWQWHTLAACAITLAHAAHGSGTQQCWAVGAGRQQSLAVLTPASAWQICFPSHLGDAACCCSAVPGCSLGQAGELMGFSFPQCNSCCDQTKPRLSRGSQPLHGVTQPSSQHHFQANSSFFSTLISAEAVGQWEEMRAGRGG